MPSPRADLVALIVDRIKELNPPALLSGGVAIDDTTRLFGPHAIFDSIGLVSLIVEVEQAVIDTTGVSLTLADERAMSQRQSPFRSVGTLADYIVLLLAEHGRT